MLLISRADAASRRGRLYRPTSFFLALAALVVATLAARPRAMAHGVIPLDTTGLATAPTGQPGAATAPWLGALTAGALVSRDQGKSYAWICEEALVGPAVDDLAIAVTGEGTLLAGNGNSGLLVSDDLGCTWQGSGAFVLPNTFSGLALHPAEPGSWYVTSNATADGHGTVWRTRDGGRTYTPLKFAEPGVYLTSVAVTGNALVVAGTNNRAQKSAQVYVSFDDGTSWRGGTVLGGPDLASDVRVFPIGQGGQGGWAVAVLDGRNNASTVLLAGGPTGPWRVAHALGEPVRQVASSPDGRQILVGGMHKVAFSRDGGQAFSVPKVPGGNGCAANLGGTLMTCGSKAFGDGFSFATLTGDGPTFRGDFSFTQVRGPHQCPAGTPTHDLCLPLWPEAAQRFGASAAPPKNLVVDLPKPPRQPVQAKAQGCACNAAAQRERPWHEGLGQALAALMSLYVLRLAPTPPRRQRIKVRLARLFWRGNGRR